MSNLTCPKCERSAPAMEGKNGWFYSHKYDMFYCMFCLEWCVPQTICPDETCDMCIKRKALTPVVGSDAMDIDDYPEYGIRCDMKAEFGYALKTFNRNGISLENITTLTSKPPESLILDRNIFLRSGKDAEKTLEKWKPFFRHLGIENIFYIRKDNIILLVPKKDDFDDDKIPLILDGLRICVARVK